MTTRRALLMTLLPVSALALVPTIGIFYVAFAAPRAAASGAPVPTSSNVTSVIASDEIPDSSVRFSPERARTPADARRKREAHRDADRRRGSRCGSPSLLREALGHGTPRRRLGASDLPSRRDLVQRSNRSHVGRNPSRGDRTRVSGDSSARVPEATLTCLSSSRLGLRSRSARFSRSFIRSNTRRRGGAGEANRHALRRAVVCSERRLLPLSPPRLECRASRARRTRPLGVPASRGARVRGARPPRATDHQHVRALRRNTTRTRRCGRRRVHRPRDVRGARLAALRRVVVRRCTRRRTSGDTREHVDMARDSHFRARSPPRAWSRALPGASRTRDPRLTTPGGRSTLRADG